MCEGGSRRLQRLDHAEEKVGAWSLKCLYLWHVFAGEGRHIYSLLKPRAPMI